MTPLFLALSPTASKYLNSVAEFAGLILLFVVSTVAIFLGQKIKEGIYKSIESKVKKQSSLKPSTAAGHREIQRLLDGLQQKFEALRVCVFQFHNGNSFMLSNHAWKVSCTQESLGSQIRSMIMAYQSLPASSLMDWVDPLLNSDYLPDGVTLVEPCKSEKANTCPFGRIGHRILRFEPHSMRMSAGQALANEYGIVRSFAVPMIDPQTKAVFGFITLQFGARGPEITPEFEHSLCAMCPVAEQVQFYLTTDFAQYRAVKKRWWHAFFPGA